jgi:hypothetical protein
MTDPRPVFGLSITMSLFGWIMLAWLYVWPRLSRMDRTDALAILVAPHMLLRFVGLSFLVPGVVSSDLPAAFAVPAAYGDLASGILAIIATINLARRTSWAVTTVWVFNVVGAADLLFAFYQGARLRIDPGALGASYFIVTWLVPALIVTHALAFRVLAASPTRRRVPTRLPEAGSPTAAR